MRQLSESFFKMICFSFSAFVLVLFLLTTIDVSVECDRRSQLVKEVQSLSEENERLQARVEQELSLEAIGRYASEKLGMRPSAPGQIVYLELAA